MGCSKSLNLRQITKSSIGCDDASGPLGWGASGFFWGGVGGVFGFGGVGSGAVSGGVSCARFRVF